VIDWYVYEGQIKSYMLQFCNIFSGLKVQTGKGECGEAEFMTVPVIIGSRDRVVAAIQAGNTQNKPFSMPMMSVHMSGINLATYRKGIGVVDKRVYLPEGGVYPNDLKAVVRVMPIPYTMSVDMTICASNMNQRDQILEQILMLFDPILQIQTSDSAFDWTKITTVELRGITNEENYPLGGDRRIISWTLSFEVPIYISAPVDVRDELVRKIIVRIGNLDGFTINQVNENGELVPFDETYAYMEITNDGVVSSIPPEERT
jgi:hypothetical protein